MKTITHIEDAITAIKDGCANIALNLLEEARLNEKARNQLIDDGVMPNHQSSEKSEACAALVTPQQCKPLTDWVSVDERLPESGGYYLVTVDTDDGPHVDVLLYSANEKHWEHEGEPTYCHSYYFNPTHWAARPEAAHGITSVSDFKE